MAEKLLGRDFYIVTKPLLYLENNSTSGFNLYVPPGFLVEKPLLNNYFSLLVPSKYNDCLIMYIYMLETRTIFHNKKPVAIEKKGCDLVLIDMLESRGMSKSLVSLVKISLKLFKGLKQNNPIYLLRKNAVEFYIREKAKIDGYYS